MTGCYFFFAHDHSTSLADGSVTSPRGLTRGRRVGRPRPTAPSTSLIVRRDELRHRWGVHTQRRACRPMLYDTDLLSERPGRIRAVAMNARVANACTGAPGLEAARAMAQAAEQAAALPPRTALVLSTGVIGVPLPVDRVSEGLRQAAGRLSPTGGIDAARAIMTTDTRVKHCAVRLDTPHGPITVGGIAKGAGMIHPDMATLLAVLTTDAVAEPAALAPLFHRVVDRTFNAISVDADTSTNDTVLRSWPEGPRAWIPRATVRCGCSSRRPSCWWLERWHSRSSPTARAQPKCSRSRSSERRASARRARSGARSPGRHW
jgi:glutamate N-acetyltransferase/amino-acid N-acetyltransferase